MSSIPGYELCLRRTKSIVQLMMSAMCVAGLLSPYPEASRLMMAPHPLMPLAIHVLCHPPCTKEKNLGAAVLPHHTRDTIK
jgi:hypothetical protein